jgi:hypothetical protein
MNDEQALTAVRQRLAAARDQLGDQHMTTPASEIIARSTRRRRRRWLASGAAVCAAAGLTAGLMLPAGHPTAPAPAQLAAWTLHANKDGTVTFTVREATDASSAAQLQRALARAGVPAVVRWGEICQTAGPGVQAMDPGDSVQAAAGTPSGFAGTSWMTMNGNGTKDNLGWGWTIYPSRVPRGGHFVISALPGPVPATQVQGLWEFARIGVPISCVAHMKA